MANSGGGQSAALLRLMTELRVMRQEPPEGCSAGPITEADMFAWSATIFGPPDTPWEGGVYSLRLSFPAQYPAKAPRVRFTTKMYHPNIGNSGEICLDIIKSRWTPSYTVSTILTSIQSLLTDPNPGSCLNGEAGNLFRTDIKAYNAQVRKCAEQSME